MQQVCVPFVHGDLQVIEIAQKEDPIFATALRTPGGFVWWYADVVNGSGDGCVLVWSFGLPFLPGSRERKVARCRPALHFAFYKEGKEQFYLLNQHPAEDADVDLLSGSVRIGSSQITLVEDGEQVRLKAQIDEPLSGTSDRLMVELESHGSPFVSEGSEVQSSHLWSPRTVDASGSMQLRCGDAHEELEGSAYIDSNASSQSLHDQGISSWRWGRVRFPDGTLVFYEVEGKNRGKETLAFFQDLQGGRVEGLQLHFGGACLGAYGVLSPRTLRVEGAGRSYLVDCEHLVDDGPFYQRFLLTALDATGQVGSGVGEVVLPPLIDLPWQRPLVKMKTFNVGGDNSMWLPLFTGNRETRRRRMLQKVFFNGGEA